MVGRSLLALMLCLAMAATLWGVSLVVPSGEVASSVAGPAAHLDAPLPPAAQLRLDTTPAQALAAPAQPSTPDQPPPPPEPNPLEKWAAKTAPLLGIPDSALIGYGTADLMMQDKEPKCGLSWITLAAVGRVDAQQWHPQSGVPAAVTTAQQLCAHGRDTSTDSGWEAAVRSVGDGTAHLHQVLAAATAYATAVQSNIPISPPALAAINFAIDQIGLPYEWGGNGPRQGDPGFDCSGLTKAAYASAGIELPRTAAAQYFATRHLGSHEALQPGDLVFYANPVDGIHHVGLYIGNGEMINAPTFGMPVQVGSYRYNDYAGAGRPY
ncbi:MAG: C40 family peptidase [Pseudonocardiaceae bacterium]